jgi:exopolysaccharide production protein ExoQ
MKSWETEDSWNVGLMMLFALGGYVPLLMSGLASQASQLQFENSAGSPLSRAIIAFMFVAAMIPIARMLPKLLRSGSLLLPLMPYFLWALASVSWSQDPSVSARKIFSFILTCAYGFYFASRFSLQRQLRIVLFATSILAICSVILVLAAPQLAIDHSQHLGAWQGIFSGKNPCAATMVIGLAAAIFFRPPSALQRVVKVMMILLFAGIVSRTDSSGAVVAAAVLLLSLPVFQLLAHSAKKAHALILLGSFAATVGTIITAYLCMPFILGLLHRDPTLTGRTQLWTEVMHSIALRPWMGYGYGAFWLGLKGQSANVAFRVNWTAPHAHNGYLDIGLSLGLIGVALFFFSLLCACVRVWQLMQSGALKNGMWMVSVIILVLTFNMGESVLISAPSLMWILYVAAITGLERAAAERRSVKAPRVYAYPGTPFLTPALVVPPTR